MKINKSATGFKPQYRLAILLFAILLTPYNLFSQCLGCTMTVSSNSTATITLTSTDVLCISGGTYTGTITSFPVGARICVSGNASFNPSSMPSSYGSVTIGQGCSALLPSFSTGNGFIIDNYGTVTFTSSFTLGGISTLNNYEGGYMTISQIFTLESVGSSINNSGTLTFSDTYTGNNSTEVNNHGYWNCLSSFSNGSGFQNYGRITVAGEVSFSSGAGSFFHNYCTLISDGNITNSNTNAYGFINYGVIVADAGSSTITNSSSCTFMQTATGTIRGLNFTNSGIITGKGRYYFTGTTRSLAGSFGADGGGINFFDTGLPSNIMDVETIAPDASVTKISFTPPTRATLVSTCQITENQSPIAADDFYTTPQNTSLFGNVFVNDIDPENNSLFLGSTVIANPGHSAAFSLYTNGDFTYTPVSGYYGTDLFIYTVCDYGTPAKCDTATVFITITQNTVSIPACDNPGSDPANTLGAVPNTYFPATASVTAGSTTITLGSYLTSGASAPVTAGDKLMIIQIQGGDINFSNNDSYGDGFSGGYGNGLVYNSYTTAGNYEFVTAAGSLPLSGGTLALASPLVNSYTHGDYIAGSNGKRRFQVIRVPQYNNLTLSADITVPAWNGSAGGVFCISVANSFNLAGHIINAKGKGFRGGAGRSLTGSAGNDGDYRTVATLSANGSKGEGIAGTPRYLNSDGVLLDNSDEGYPMGSYAQGAPGNAGGGGSDGHSNTINDENTGGGGGGNGGSGGKGGNAWNSAEPTGGEPGALFMGTAPARLILGGGGGAASTNDATGSPSDGLASSGAAGGGIVIIYANQISNTGTIDVCGLDANTTVLNDGSGGGGAGGSVLLVSNSPLSAIKVLAAGGDGGTNTGGGSPYGPGGGGGGGVIYSTSPVNYASKVSGGQNGTTTTASPIAYGSLKGNNGILRTDIKKNEMPSGLLGCNNFIAATNDDNITPLNTAVSGNVLLNDYDTEGDAVVFSGFYNSDSNSYLTTGNLTLQGIAPDRTKVNNAGLLSFSSDGAYTFTPATGFSGKADIQYKVTDDDNYRSVSYGILSVSVLQACNNSNDIVPLNDNAVTYANIPVTLNVLSNDLDPQGDSLIFNGLMNPSNSSQLLVSGSLAMTGIDRYGDTFAYAGTLSFMNDGVCTFSPVPYFVGTININYEVCDDNSNQVCKKSNLRISVEPLHSIGENFFPTVGNNGAITYINTPVTGSSLLGNAGDANGMGITINTTPVSGPSHGTLTIYSNGTYLYTPVPGFSGSDSFIYQVCDNATTPSCTSGTAYLYVSGETAVVNDDPDDADICIGSNTFFETIASGTNISFQWQVSTDNGGSWNPVTDNALYSGSLTSRLDITSAPAGLNNYLYRCYLPASCGSATTNAARLSVGSGTVSIITDPSGISVCAGSNTALFVVATGPSLSYQWQLSTNEGETWSNVSNSSVYSGATTQYLSMTGVTSGMNNYRYRCLVSSSCTTSQTSQPALLSVGSPAVNIVNDPENETACSGTDVFFSTYATGASLTYQWQENKGTGWNNISASGLYQQVTNDTLKLHMVTPGMSGFQYRCVISSACALAVTSAAAILTVNTKPYITGIYEGHNCGSGTVSLSAVASAGTINWYDSFTGGSVIGTGNSFTTPIIPASTFYYADATSGSCRSVERASILASVTSDVPSILSSPSDITGCEGSYESFSVNASTNATGYQWQLSADGGNTWNSISDNTLYTGAMSRTLTVKGIDRTMTGYRYRCQVTSTCLPAAISNEALLTVNFPPEIQTAPVRAWVCPGSVASFNVTATGGVTAYRWQLSTNSGTSWSDIFDNATYSGSATSILVITGTTVAMDNYQYRCIITGNCLPSTTSGSAILVTNANTITINTQPSSTSACAGIPTSLTVVASGPSLTYQWQYDMPGGGVSWNNIADGGIYSNSNSATLVLSDISTVVGYNYQCVISSTCAATVASGTATLSLNTAYPTISTQPSGSEICESLGTTFSVAATVPSGTTLYQWQTSIDGGTSWSNTLNSGGYSGANTTPLNLSESEYDMNGYQFRCRVTSTSNTVCPLNSSPAELTVNPLPDAPVTAYSDLTTLCADDPGNINLSVSGGSGTTIRWFSGNCNGTVIGTGNPLSIASPEFTTTYYARYETSCGYSDCASVTVIVIPLPVVPTSVISDNNNFCQNDPGDINLTVTGGSGTLVHWFTGSCGVTPVGTGIPLTIPSPAVTTTYYASYANACGVSTCASLTVNVLPSPAPPSASSTQTFCTGSVISDLAVTPPTGCTFYWYAAESGGLPLQDDYLLTNGGIYYAESVNLTTSCTSDSRTAVSVVIIPATPAPTGTALQFFCATANPVIDDIIVNGTGVIWYTTSSGSTVVSPSTPLTDGSTYYASQTLNGCESQSRLGVTVSINPCNPLVSLSVNTNSITESGPGVASLTATISYVSLRNVVVNIGYTGTATAGGVDYTAASSIVVPAGSLSASIPVTAVTDNVYEPGSAETIIADIASVADGTENGTQQQIISISDSNSQPSVALSANFLTVNEAGGISTLTATLSNYSTQNVTVNIAFSGTATGGGIDYNSSSSTITVAAGSLTGTLTLTAIDDNIFETSTNETITADISSVTNATESGVQQVSVQITDNDSQPTVSLSGNNATITEASGVCVFTATLSNPSVQNVTVNLAYSGTATAGGVDYSSSSGAVTINAGGTSGTASVTAVDDIIYEPGANETIIADITSVINGTENGTQQQSTAIVDNDIQPAVTLSVNNSTIPEASGSALFTVTLNHPSTQNVTVTLAFTGTATGGSVDYTASATVITVTALSTTATASVTAVDDNIYEPGANETIIADIASVTNGTESGVQQQTVSITDNDPLPSVSLSGNIATINESSAGLCSFTMTLSNPSAQAITVSLGFSGTATGGGIDYSISGSAVTLPAGSLSDYISVTAVNDNLYEPGANETVIVDITLVTNATENGTQQQSVAIVDDDTPPSVTLSQNAASITEAGGVCTLTALLDHPSTQILTVTLAYSGTAIGGGVDYTASGTVITIPAGALSGTVTLTATDDNIYESAVNETIIAEIATVTNGVESGTQQRSVNITENDAPPAVTLTVSSTTLTEAGPGSALFTATLNRISVQSVTVTLSFTGTATGSGTDYNTSGNAITITAGSLTGNVTITAVDDNLDEPDETVIADIVTVTNGSENGTQQRTATIIDDDVTPVINNTSTGVYENSPAGTSVGDINDAGTGTDIDGDLDPIVYSIVSGNGSGAFAINSSTGVISVASSAPLNYEVVTSFVLLINATDGLNNDQAQVTINVLDVNEAPVAVKDQYTSNEDTPSMTLTVTSNDSDPDSDPLSVSLAQMPSHGTASVSGQNIIYVPALNYNGNDTLLYKVCDDGAPSLCDTDSVIIKLLPVNDTPVAVNDEFTTFVGYPYEGNLIVNDSDIDGNPLTLNITPVQPASHGTLTLNPDGTFRYVPDVGFIGTDIMYYRVCDNGTPALCANAMLTIHVEIILNKKPVAADDAGIVDEDHILNGTGLLANDSDPDGNSLAVASLPVTDVQHGTLVLNIDGSYSYTPALNYYGTDTFEYRVCDNGIPSLCDTALVTITITAVNDKPVASDDNTGVSEDGSVDIDVLANDSDIENNTLHSSLFNGSGPDKGVAVVNADGTIKYTPSPDFNGSDSFRYVVCDNGSPSECDTAIVYVTVSPVNDAPVTNSYSSECRTINLAIPFSLFVTDIDNDLLTLTVNSGPASGTVEITGDMRLIYYAASTSCGLQTISYTACDPGGLCASGSISVTVIPVDTDNDGIPDYVESTTNDSDSDGTPNYMETDSDNDGISDALEVLGNISDPCNIVIENSDNDLWPDYMDTDSDNDGITDSEEGTGDCDDNGVPDYRDPVTCDRSIHVPEGFSPNGDTHNEYLIINGLEFYPNHSITIFNRWGNIVFKAKPYNNDWDGTSSGSLTLGKEILPAGTYFYIINPGDGSKEISGYIYIAR